MTTELINILHGRLGADEAKIEKIKALNGNNPQSALQAIKSQGLLDELTLLQASSTLLGLGVLQ